MFSYPYERWSSTENDLFILRYKPEGENNWDEISDFIGTKSPLQVRNHARNYKKRNRPDDTDFYHSSGSFEELSEIPEFIEIKRSRNAYETSDDETISDIEDEPVHTTLGDNEYFYDLSSIRTSYLSNLSVFNNLMQPPYYLSHPLFPRPINSWRFSPFVCYPPQQFLMNYPQNIE